MKDINSFFIDSSLTKNLIKVLKKLKSENKKVMEDTHTKDGFQTGNILEFKNNLQIKKDVEKMLLNKYNVFHIHLIDYNKGGYQERHNHAKTEDYSFIIYLNTAEKGETVFENIGKVKCEENKIIVFKSNIWHYGLPCSSRKLVAVGAMNKK